MIAYAYAPISAWTVIGGIDNSGSEPTAEVATKTIVISREQLRSAAIEEAKRAATVRERV